VIVFLDGGIQGTHHSQLIADDSLSQPQANELGKRCRVGICRRRNTLEGIAPRIRIIRGLCN
jgi:hypothetical protein